MTGYIHSLFLVLSGYTLLFLVINLVTGTRLDTIFFVYLLYAGWWVGIASLLILICTKKTRIKRFFLQRSPVLILYFILVYLLRYSLWPLSASQAFYETVEVSQM